MNGNCLIGQSGGPTAVINTSLYGLIKEAFLHPEIHKVYGAINGLTGVLKENFVEFNKSDLDKLSSLIYTPSAILGSVRYKMPNYEDDPNIYEQIQKTFVKYNISFFFYIGGNDSMDTCHKIAQYFLKVNFPCSVIGIPKTIDNDMVETDHTPGYASSSKYIATTIAEIYQDISCYETGRVTFVEIMGRDSGWLTCASLYPSIIGMGPDLIYVPEVPFFIDSFINDVKELYQKKKKVLIAVAEGIKDDKGNYYLQKRLYNNNDDFGHLQLGGVGMVLAEIINKELNLPVRSIELNINERCASHLLSKTDIEEALLISSFGIKKALEGVSDQTIIIKRINNNPYQISLSVCPLGRVANYIKQIPSSWINNRGNMIKKEFIDYISPLIEGEIDVPYENGLPKFIKLEDITSK